MSPLPRIKSEINLLATHLIRDYARKWNLGRKLGYDHALLDEESLFENRPHIGPFNHAVEEQGGVQEEPPAEQAADPKEWGKILSLESPAGSGGNDGLDTASLSRSPTK